MSSSGGTTPKFRRFRLKKSAVPDVQTTPSSEEINTGHASSSSPPTTNTGNSSNKQWDMSAIDSPESSTRKKKKSVSAQERLLNAAPVEMKSKAPPPPPRSSPKSSPEKKEKKLKKKQKALIEKSKGTSRLNRILHQPNRQQISYVQDENENMNDKLYSPRKSSKFDATVRDPLDETQVGRFAARVVVPPLKVDPRSIGGMLLLSSTSKSKSMTTRIQECLLCTRCKSFDFMSGNNNNEMVAISPSALEDPAMYAKHKRGLGLGTKARNKFRFVLLVRSTNRPLEQDDHVLQDNNNTEDDDDDDDDLSTAGFDDLYTLDPADATTEATTQQQQQQDKKKQELEVSSFPVLVCMTLHSDGTNPDIRKLQELDQLTTVQDVVALGGGSTMVQLAFRDGSTVKIDFGVLETPGESPAAGMKKERFLWGLLQIHAMLCTSVVERNSLEARNTTNTSTSMGRAAKLLQPLTILNLDRAELQYVATVNGFLRDSTMLCALLDRQRNIGAPATKPNEQEEEEEKQQDSGMDGMAYDVMMGNYSTRVALFVSAEERADAEEILNITNWESSSSSSHAASNTPVMAAAADSVSDLLQRRMRDLEAETCRRLIAWEDEKHYSLTTGRAQGLFSETVVSRDTSDALSLAALFTTLDTLEEQLGDMEVWLEERAIAIKPLTDDCREIEEENRQLEQNYKSCDMLGRELMSLLHGLDVPKELDRVLKTPAAALVYSEDGAIVVDKSSEKGVAKIYEAGMWLKEAMDRAKRAGGVHLTAVSERAESLVATADQFCTGVANIVATVMEQIAGSVVAGSDNGKVSKMDTNSTIAKKVRDTQRQFQSELLGYIKLIEVLQQLKPILLPAIRDAYSEMVADGILMKKRMKGYFQALPGKNQAYLQNKAKNLQDYEPFGEPGSMEHTVNAPDIEAALSELLPVVAREAYFTAALFGLGSKELDGREKKRNFESAKNSVDHSSHHFRYYIQRTVGIVSEADLEKGVPPPDPMLSLVSSIVLNDMMTNYIDREKKGGDQSLSLAYVRATIMDLRKKVDKQWVAWVEQEIEWIKTNEGVPLSGKRAGVFASFARFPAYLDHILLCVRQGHDADFTVDFANIKVVNYYLQKMANALLESLRDCSERETTDQAYGANVMRMENSYFFTQSIKKLGPEFTTLFQKQVARASAQCKQSTDNYLGWMIKREFKELHALFSNVSRIRRDVGDKDVATHFSRSNFVKTLSKESSREVMKDKIRTIYSRMGKHLSEDGGILPVAWKALVKVLYEWFGRWEKLSSKCYGHVLEPSAVDVVRIAKTAGGSDMSRRPSSTQQDSPPRAASASNLQSSKRNVGGSTRKGPPQR